MVILDFWVNAIVSFELSTKHNWHPRAPHFSFFFFPTSQLWVAGGRNISPGSVLPFWWVPCPPRWGCILQGAGWLGYLVREFFLLYLLWHSLPLCFLLITHFEEKISVNNSLLLLSPHLFWGERNGSNNEQLVSREFSANHDAFSFLLYKMRLTVEYIS